jgi:hypothetical protein
MDLIIIDQPRVFPYRKGYQIAKRVMDLALCLLAMPLVLPLLALGVAFGCTNSAPCSTILMIAITEIF